MDELKRAGKPLFIKTSGDRLDKKLVRRAARKSLRRSDDNLFAEHKEPSSWSNWDSETDMDYFGDENLKTLPPHERLYYQFRRLAMDARAAVTLGLGDSEYLLPEARAYENAARMIVSENWEAAQ